MTECDPAVSLRYWLAPQIWLATESFCSKSYQCETGCRPRRLVRVGNSNLRVPSPQTLTNLHCKPGRPVQIEPGLRPESPENGNYSMNGQRLSAFSAGYSANLESGDRLGNCESPPVAGFSATG